MALPRTDIERVCVFRALQLGDMVCAGPALRALRARFPAAAITLVGLPWAADFAARMSAWVDDFVDFPGWPGLPERAIDLDRLPEFLCQMQQRRFDLALQLHGSGRLTNTLVRAFAARRTVGFRPSGTGGASSRHIEYEAEGDYWPYPDDLHEVHRNLKLVAHLGASDEDDRVVFPLTPADHEELRLRRPDLAPLPALGYVCLHPGARDAAKRWPPAYFARVGDALAGLGWKIILTGSGAEQALAQVVASLMHAPAVNAACDISIGALAALMSRARLVVSNDTGVAHVAAGLGVASVVVFFATDPRRWAPLDRKRNIVIHDPQGVAPEAVVQAARALLHHFDAQETWASARG